MDSRRKCSRQKTHRANPPIERQTREQDHRHIAQGRILVNGMGHIVMVEIWPNGIEEHEVGLKMKRRMERAAAMVFVADKITPGGLEDGPNERSEMRFVVDQ